MVQLPVESQRKGVRWWVEGWGRLEGRGEEKCKVGVGGRRVGVKALPALECYADLAEDEVSESRVASFTITAL